jgi:hypothetical protein
MLPLFCSATQQLLYAYAYNEGKKVSKNISKVQLFIIIILNIEFKNLERQRSKMVGSGNRTRDLFHPKEESCP